MGSFTFKAAGTQTITASDAAGALQSATSAGVTVGVGAFAKLQLLVPGETASPGSTSGKTGTPASQISGNQFSVTVNSVDANWNLISTNDTVKITSSDSAATLPPNAALVSGTKPFAITLITVGSSTVTASNFTHSGITLNTSPSIAVSSSLLTQATGGLTISADNTGGTWTTLSGPSYGESAAGAITNGTYILNAPTGFIFDISTAPTVLVHRNGGGNNTAINGVKTDTSFGTTVTTNQISFIVTNQSSGATSTLTWQNVHVRPTAGTPLASGNLFFSGATFPAVSTNSNAGSLKEVAGAANNLAIKTQP